jgi:tetratricopeptide (TPR) repeat protein
MAKERSPFGALLRAHRLQQGLSQQGLSQLIADRSLREPQRAELGILSAKAIANLEAERDDPSRYVRPRPLTVRLLATTLGIATGSPEEAAFLRAADLTRGRMSEIPDDAPAPTPITTETRQQPAFIREGREDHVQHLERLVDSALAGNPQLTLIAVEPGVGKTWMITEICRLAGQRNPDLVVAWGECTSGAAAVEPYLPFCQALGHILGNTWGKPAAIVSTHDQRQRRAVVLEAVLTYAPALVGASIDESLLIAQADELGIADKAWRDRLSDIVARRSATDMQGRFDQVTQLLGALAAHNPMILVLEDLHWADERTCTLLLHLQRRLHHATNVPVLILGSYRPSDLVRKDSGDRHPLELVINEIGRYRDQVVIDLSTTVGAAPGRAFVDALLDRLSSDIDDGLGSFLFQRTKGYPLFAVELLQWLRDTGTLAQNAIGRWRLSSETPRVRIPDKVRAVIAERLARLPQPLQRVLAVAAVQGSVFSADVVATILQLSADDVDDLIDDQLARRYRLVNQAETSIIDGKRLYRYRFAHALFQEHLYDTLSERERERMHGSTARALEDMLGTDAHGGSSEIAFHFERAGEPEGAGTHAFAAGKHSIHMLGYEVAAGWFERAIAFAEAAGDTELAGHARNGIAGSMRNRGRTDDGIRIATDALDEARRHGCMDVQAESLALLGLFAYDTGKHTHAAAYLRQSLALYRELDDLAAACGIDALLSHAWYGQGAYDLALQHGRSAYETARAIGNQRYAAEGLLAAANCEVDLGRYDIAVGMYQEAASTYHEAGDLRGDALCQLNTGLCQIQLGAWERSLQVLTETREFFQELRLPRLLAATDHYLGLAHEESGDIVEAARLHQRAFDQRRKLNQPGLSMDCMAGLLRASTVHGDRDRMHARLEEIEGWIREHGVEGIEDPIRTYLSCAYAHVALGNDTAATASMQAAHDLLTVRAERITAPEARQSYLEQVPANRAVMHWMRNGKRFPPT